MNKKTLIKKLKPYWKEFKKIEDNFLKKINNLEKKAQKELKIEDLEFFFCDGYIAGIGNYSRTMKLIHSYELEEE